MRTDQRPAAGLRLAIALGGAASLGACASGFAQADFERVRGLANVTALPAIAPAAVDPEPSAAVSTLLSRPLDADTAARIAVLNHREVRASLRDIGIARGRLIEARTIPNPHLELEKPVEPEVRYEVGLEIDITAALLAPLRTGAASAQLEAGRYSAARTIVDVAFAARAAFFAAQAAEQKLAIAQRSLDAYAAARDAARALHDAGNIPALALASQEAAYERARVLVAGVELEVAETREELHRSLGLHGKETHWKMAGFLPSPPQNLPAEGNLEAAALKASLELGESRARLEGLARRTGLARAEGWLPDVAVGVRGAELAHDVGAEAVGVAHGNDGRWRFGAGVTISLPIFDRKQGQLASLGAELDSAHERLHGTAIRVRSATRDIANRLSAAHARVRQYETMILPAQRRVTQQTVLQFNAMQVGVFQLLLARREELDAELAYVESLRDYWTAAAAREALLAGSTPQTSARRPTTTPGTSSESQGGH